jgi:hypothetical protein
MSRQSLRRCLMGVSWLGQGYASILLKWSLVGPSPLAPFQSTAATNEPSRRRLFAPFCGGGLTCPRRHHRFTCSWWRRCGRWLQWLLPLRRGWWRCRTVPWSSWASFRPSLWTRASQVVPDRNALMMSPSATSGSSLYCLEKRQIYSRRVLPSSADSSGGSRDFWVRCTCLGSFPRRPPLGRTSS